MTTSARRSSPPFALGRTRVVVRRSEARGVKRGAKRARVMSRLPPLPGARSTSNPAPARPSRTARAALQVATVASAAASRAIALNTRASHISGLRAGAKPSRKNASTRATSCGSQASTAPNASSSSTAPSSNAIRCRLQVSGGQWRGELGSQRNERIVARDARERGLRRRRLLDRDEVELAAARRVVAPRGPGREEVVAEAEPGLEDDEAIAAAPARGERAVGEEHVASLRERARARVVDVAVLGRSRRAVVVDDDLRRDDRRGVHGSLEAAASRAASQASRRSRTPSRRR